MSTDLDARYGRSQSSAKRTRVIAWTVAGAFAAVFTAWLVWGGLLGSPAQLEVTDRGHSIVNDRLVSVDFTLNVPPGTDVGCAVQALNPGFSVVGWKVIEVPASTQRIRTLTEEVRTTEQANTGLIYRCWLA